MDTFQNRLSCISRAVEVSNNDGGKTRILAYHLRKTPRSCDVSCMYQAVKVPCRLLNLLSHIIITIQVKDISDEVESVLVILNICIEPSEVESVCEVVFVDLAEVFIASRRDELRTDLSASVHLYRYSINTKAKSTIQHKRRKPVVLTRPSPIETYDFRP